MKIFFFNIILLFTFYGFSQDLKTAVSQNKIFIGEEIVLTYSVKLSKSDIVNFTPKKYEIPCYLTGGTSSLTTGNGIVEILQPFYDTTISNRKNTTWIGKYTVTAWDSGNYVIPEQRIQINDSTFTFKPVIVSVILMEDSEDIDIYDIREKQADLPSKPLTFLEFINKFWWVILIGIIGIGFAIFQFVRRRNKEPEEIKQISLKEKTLFAIENLEERKLWEKKLLKEHFVELSLILRMYLSSRYQISLLDKTTYETSLLLKQVGLEQGTISGITQILSESDMVKFAKSKPDIMAILKVSTLAKQIVAETSPLDFDNVE